MAIKTISQFDAATPTSNDKILFEQNGEGRSTTIGNAVNTCSLTLEEIQASTNLTGKVASAEAISKRLVVVTPYYRTFSANEYAAPYASSAVFDTDINYSDFISAYAKDTPYAYSLSNKNGKCTITVYGNQLVIGQNRAVYIRHFKQ